MGLLREHFYNKQILLSHSRQTTFEQGWDIGLFVTFKDLLILAVPYFIAIRYWHNVELYARGMIATRLVCIEPAAARIFIFSQPFNGYFIFVFCFRNLDFY
jgi:hypothetical protein